MDTVVFPTSVMSVEDILDFVVARYGADPAGRRSLNPDYEGDDTDDCKCLYNGPDGRMCAFRLFVRDTKANKLKEGDGANECLDSVCDLLRPEVADLFGNGPFGFWNYVQGLHDEDRYWHNLNEAKRKAEKIVSEFSSLQIPKHARWAARGKLTLEVSKGGEAYDAMYDYWLYDVEGALKYKHGGVSETMVGACENIVQDLQQQNLPYPSVKELTTCIETENNYQHLDWDSATAFL